MAAILLVTFSSPAEKADAAVNGISVAPSKVFATGFGTPSTTVATIDVDQTQPTAAGALNTGEVNVLLSAGSFAAINCISTTGAFTVSGAASCLTQSAQGTVGPVAPGGTAQDLDPAGGILANVQSTWVGPNAAAPGATDLDTVLATIAAPTVGPATIVVTAIQGTSVKTGNVTVYGTPAEVTVTVNTALNGTATAGNGIMYKVIPSSTATVLSSTGGALPAGQVVANIDDSAGNNVPGATVVFTSTAGTITNPASTTNSIGNAGVTAGALTTITGGATGTNGTEATITANTSGKSGTTTVKFGGDPASCTISGDPDETSPGTTSLLTGTFLDSSGGPIPDGVGIAFATVNAVTGSLAIVGTSTSSDGMATTNLLLGAPGGVAIAAALAGPSIPGGAAFASLSCQNSVIVSGTTVPPSGGTGGTGDGTISGTLPTSGFGLVTFGGSVDQLKTALATACPSGAPIFATSGGSFVGYFSTTTLEAPNAGFLALYGAAGLPANTPLLGGNC
jgi:adhesin/invasin